MTDYTEPVREYYPLKWWQLWRWNPYWCGTAFRYRWMRDLWFHQRTKEYVRRIKAMGDK